VPKQILPIFEADAGRLTGRSAFDSFQALFYERLDSGAAPAARLHAGERR
jgi:hypothetical protein